MSSSTTIHGKNLDPVVTYYPYDGGSPNFVGLKIGGDCSATFILQPEDVIKNAIALQRAVNKLHAIATEHGLPGAATNPFTVLVTRTEDGSEHGPTVFARVYAADAHDAMRHVAVDRPGDIVGNVIAAFPGHGAVTLPSESGWPAALCDLAGDDEDDESQD